MNGAMLETFVFSELLKSYWHNGRYPNLYFYRDADQKEVDFVFEQNMTLYPVEVKKSATPSLVNVKNFDALKRLNKDIGHGAIICLRERHIPLSHDVASINIGYL